MLICSTNNWYVDVIVAERINKLITTIFLIKKPVIMDKYF